jgi:aspartate/methionine/tyrosine aminotransferase
MRVGQINELLGLEELEGLAAEYEEEYGSLPFNLSHWDPSDHTSRSLLKYLRLPKPPDAMPYIYSYYTGAPRSVAERLGFEWAGRDCLLVHSGTSAIVLTLWWVKAMGFEQLVILCPTYFPVFYLAEVMSMPSHPIFTQRERGNWSLPREELLRVIGSATSKAVVWVTNPIYCTGVYLSESDREFLGSLLDSGVTIVADECLAKNGSEMSRELGGRPHFVGLYTPHKSLCLNAIKFGAVVFDRKDEEFFDSWADVFTGGLSASNHSGIFHFLDEVNFSKFDMEFFNLVEHARNRVTEMLDKYDGTVEVDENSVGHFMTCYIPRLAGGEGDNKQFLRRLVSDTASVVISGMRNHFNPEWGFCFRINLARACPQFYASLERTLNHLAAEC